ncbi:MAG: N-acetylmuramoyl-L-alanine amidase [Novosphingobium sp.]
MQFAMLALAPVAVFALMVAADRAFGAPGRGDKYVLRIELPQGEGAIGLPEVEGPPDAGRPLVVIDAGHGGHDPGAGTGAVREKQVTLMLARALRDRLLENGGIRVALTRGDDRFLSLEERSDIARRLNADLFISIHADSEEGNQASGASIYTLSERGSSEIAQRYAARENGADKVNGVMLAGKSDTVGAILLDLSQRDTEARSREFAALVMREARPRMHFRDDAVQSAAFVVLKSPDVPSALFETGYISNESDVARLVSAAGRRDFAEATARAIRLFFARHLQGA